MINHQNNQVAVPVSIADLRPSLAVTGVTVPAGAQSGHQINVAWNVSNTGAGGTRTTSWTDTVILSASGVLGAGGQPSSWHKCVAPQALWPGGSLHAEHCRYGPADGGRKLQLFVTTNPNPLVSQPAVPSGFGVAQGLSVTQNIASLLAGSVSGPAAIVAGAPALVQWTVTMAARLRRTPLTGMTTSTSRRQLTLRAR